VTCNVRKRHT